MSTGRWNKKLRGLLAAVAIVAVTGLAASGCATLQEFAALRSVAFSFDRVGEVLPKVIHRAKPVNGSGLGSQ